MPCLVLCLSLRSVSVLPCLHAVGVLPYVISGLLSSVVLCPILLHCPGLHCPVLFYALSCSMSLCPVLCRVVSCCSLSCVMFLVLSCFVLLCRVLCPVMCLILCTGVCAYCVLQVSNQARISFSVCFALPVLAVRSCCVLFSTALSSPLSLCVLSVR